MLSFGQYRNQLLKDVIIKDKQYIEWLNTQPWYKIKHKELFLESSQLVANYSKNIIVNKDQFIIYTDGACSHNGSKNAKAGLGVHFSPNNKIKIDDVSLNVIPLSERPTNNIAELMAIETALLKCREHKINIPIVIFTDSDYSIKCIKHWYPNWLKNNNLSGKKNIDILKRINNLLPLNLEFIHIRAQHDTKLEDEHSIGNKMADQLAVKGINK